MNDEQIKYMVDRFLEWRLPENFNPDAGISFKPNFNQGTAYPMKHEPVGTNLFDATQAEEMVRYLIDGMPTDELRKTLVGNPSAEEWTSMPLPDPNGHGYLSASIFYYITGQNLFQSK